MADDGSIVGSSELRPELEAALASCFDAVMAPELWPGATEALTEGLGALGSCFNMYGGAADRRMLAPMSGSYRAMLDEFLADGWGEHDLRGQRGWPLLNRGQMVILDDQIVPAAERAGAPIYAELFRRHEFDVFAALGFHANDRLWVLNIARSRTMATFEPECAEELARLRPHLARLLTFAQAMAGAAAAGAMAALEETASAAILVDWTGRVVEMNAPARQRMGAGLSVRAGRLAADRPDSQARLDGLVAAAVSPDLSRAAAGGAPITLPIPAGGALMLEAVPARAEMADAFGRTGALLILSDPARRARPAEHLLRQLYGLTAREAQVAVLIAGGDGVAEISDALKLMTSSVRQLVKTLLWKTGARRQSELVAMLSRLPDGR